MASEILDNTGPGNGLWPDGTKPLPEPMLTVFRKCSRYLSMTLVWKLQIQLHHSRAKEWVAKVLEILVNESTENNDMITTKQTYHQTYNISFTLVCNKIVDHSHVVGTSPVGVAPTTSSFLNWHLASVDWAKTTTRWDKKHFRFGIWCTLY